MLLLFAALFNLHLTLTISILDSLRHHDHLLSWRESRYDLLHNQAPAIDKDEKQQLKGDAD